MFLSSPAAKLGRRSRKMREMISEATRTIEDSQTAQALHGLLSLKADSGPSSFPALLKAVGQQRSPMYATPSSSGSVQMVQAMDGSAVEMSEVPPAVATVVVGSEGQEQPINVQHPSQYKPKAGSVMELLLQMQSQAQRAAGSNTAPMNVTESLAPISTIATLMSLANPSNSPNTQVSFSTTTPQPTTYVQTTSASSAPHVVSFPRQLTASTSSTPPTPVQMIQTMPKMQAQALTQLIQAQVGSQPVQCRPSQLTPSHQPTLVSSHAPTPPTSNLTTIYQGSKPVQGQPIPIQIMSPTGPQTAQIIQTEKGGELIFAQGLQLPHSGQSYIMHPSFVVSTSADTTTSATIANPLPRSTTVMVRSDDQQHNKSPLKKRPYPFTIEQSAASGVTSSAVQASSPVVLSPHMKVMRTDLPQLYMHGGQLVQAVPSGGDSSTHPKTVTVVVQQIEGTPQAQAITISPHLVDAAVASSANITHNQQQANNKHAELTAIVAPIIKAEPEGEVHKSQNAALNMTAMAVNISEGFDDIFRYTRTQVEQLRAEEGGNSASQIMKAVLEKVDTLQISPENTGAYSGQQVTPCRPPF